MYANWMPVVSPLSSVASCSMHTDEHGGGGEQEEVVGRDRVHLLLAEPAELAVAPVERLLVGAHDVRRLGDAGHHAPAEVLARVADVGELPVDDDVVGRVVGDQDVGDLEVTVHEPQRHRRWSVGLEIGADQPHERVSVDVALLGVDPVLDAGVDVVVPRGRHLEAGGRLLQRERGECATDFGHPGRVLGELARVALAPQADERLTLHHVDDDARAAELLARRVEPQRGGHRDLAGLVQRRQHLPLRGPVGVDDRLSRRRVLADDVAALLAAVLDPDPGHLPAVAAGDQLVVDDLDAVGVVAPPPEELLRAATRVSIVSLIRPPLLSVPVARAVATVRLSTVVSGSSPVASQQ